VINEEFNEDTLFDDLIEEEILTENDIKRLNNVTDYYSSEEQIFSPICTRKEKRISTEENPEPEFLEPTDRNRTITVKNEDDEDEEQEVSQGKFGNGHAGPTSLDLDPFFTPSKNDLLLVANDTPEDLNFQKLEDVQEVRAIGLRGPMMLSGWGYTLANRRVPEGDNFAEDRTKWKTGPVDLKWDEERKVYTCGMDMLEGYAKTTINRPSSPGQGTVFELEVLRSEDELIESEGLVDGAFARDFTKTAEIVKCVNRANLEASVGTYVIVARINYEYRPIWVDC
jgi:hypothetical protein